MSVKQLRELLERKKISVKGAVEKGDLVSKALEAASRVAHQWGTKYNLLANIVHDSPPETRAESLADPLIGGSYRVHLNNKTDDQWYEMQDLHVQEVMPQTISMSETYMMIYERKKTELI
jgi:U4/U6.U5 tri-snRNP-associated protein 2